MTRYEELKFLAKFLEKSAEEFDAKAKEQENKFLQGRNQGNANAYKLCAKWINNILEE